MPLEIMCCFKLFYNKSQWYSWVIILMYFETCLFSVPYTHWFISCHSQDPLSLTCAWQGKQFVREIAIIWWICLIQAVRWPGFLFVKKKKKKDPQIRAGNIKTPAFLGYLLPQCEEEDVGGTANGLSPLKRFFFFPQKHHD